MSGITEQKVRKDTIERRCISGNIRAVSLGSDRPRIVGYAAKYNEPSDILGNFREVIAPGFFDGVKAFDVRAVFNHDPNFVLGRSTNGTLKLYPDSIGLRVEIEPPDTTWARDLIVNIERGDINQMSFAFTMPKDRKGEQWEKTRGADGTDWIRTLIKPARILDVSVVTYPAYPQTSAAVDSQVDRIRAASARRKRILRLLELGTSHLAHLTNAAQRRRTLAKIASANRRRTLDRMGK